jgi:hypothetical protein
MLYTGPVVQVAVSTFKVGSQTYTQKVILPANSNSLIFKFKLYAEADNEIFLRFQQIYKENDWFYTFNSANVMVKRFVDRGAGQNEYAVIGALLVDMNDSFMYIMPTFPLGAGMPDNKHFEMHLHRHPNKDDGLGIGSYVPDYDAVEHTWHIGFMPMDLGQLWNNYLEVKGRPVVLFSGPVPDSLTETLNNAVLGSQNWPYGDSFKLFEEDECLYISSVVHRADGLVVRVLNRCNREVEAKLKDFDFVKDLNAGGYSSVMPKKLTTTEELTFEWLWNSGKAVVKYPEPVFSSMIPAGGYSTFRVRRI